MSFNGTRPAFDMSHYKSNINPYTRDMNIKVLQIRNTSHSVLNKAFTKYLTPDHRFLHSGWQFVS